MSDWPAISSISPNEGEREVIYPDNLVGHPVIDAHPCLLPSEVCALLKCDCSLLLGPLELA